MTAPLGINASASASNVLFVAGVSGNKRIAISAFANAAFSPSGPCKDVTRSIDFSERLHPVTLNPNFASTLAQALPSSPMPNTTTERSHASGGGVGAH